jgi:hypothetical protein
VSVEAVREFLLSIPDQVEETGVIGKLLAGIEPWCEAYSLRMTRSLTLAHSPA